MPKADLSYSINTTHRVLNRLQDAALAPSIDIRQLFRTGALLDTSFQEALLSVRLLQIRVAAQTRARSARQRSLIVIDQSTGGEIRYIAAPQPSPPISGRTWLRFWASTTRYEKSW